MVQLSTVIVTFQRHDLHQWIYPASRQMLSWLSNLSIIPAICVCVCVLSVCVSATAVSRQPLVRSDWNLPGILLGPCGCAFSRFDINRTSASQVMAIYLPNQWQDTLLRGHGWWGKGALVTVVEEWQWSMAANVMASKDREVNLILINSVCGSVVVARAKERPVWLLFLARGLKFFFFFCTYGHTPMGMH